VSDVEIDYVGTDRHEAEDFRNRKAETVDLGKGVVSRQRDSISSPPASPIASSVSRTSPAAEEAPALGRWPRPARSRVRDELIYKARPLNGIWAAAPYLHNGSVPTLEALLSPDDNARPAKILDGQQAIRFP
jgi:cytochrome c peroxidase